MTQNQLSKYAYRKVAIDIRRFPHSVNILHYEGVLIPTLGYHAIVRDGQTKKFPHWDYYVDDGKTAKLIEWNQIKLIISLKDLGASNE